MNWRLPPGNSPGYDELPEDVKFKIHTRKVAFDQLLEKMLQEYWEEAENQDGYEFCYELSPTPEELLNDFCIYVQESLKSDGHIPEDKK